MLIDRSESFDPSRVRRSTDTRRGGRGGERDGRCDADRDAEAERLEALERLVLLDTPPEEEFDDLVLLASQVCDMPMSLVSLVDGSRQWFKARLGLDVAETRRDVAFCSHAIATPNHLFTVHDASRDARFASNPLVTGDSGIRFYAGMPIVTREGHALGTVCVMDRQPRVLTPAQERCLEALARQAATLIALRERATQATRSAIAHASRSAEALQQHERGAELLDLVLRGRDLGLWDLDVPSGRWTASIQELALLGYADDPDAIDGVQWRTLVHPEDQALTTSSMEPHLRGDAPFYECTHRMRHRDGRWIWVLGRAVVVERRPDGSPRRIVGTHLDITEAQQDRLALELARQRLAETAQLAKVGGWELDLRTNALTWSREVLRIHELPPGWVPTVDNAIDFYAPEARPVIQAAVAEAIEHGTSYDLQLPLITARGRSIWVRALGHAEYEDGVAVRLTGAFQDITERRTADQALVDSERRLRLITDSLPALIMHIDGEQRYTYVNAHFERTFGVPADAVIGRTLEDVCSAAVYADIAPHVARALDGHAVEFEAVGPARGESLHYQSHYVPDVQADGRTTGFYALIFDITPAKRSELKCIESEKLLRGIADNLPVCIAEIGRDGCFRFVNETYRAWTGRDPQEMVGRSVHAEVGGTYYESRKDAVARALAGERLTFECVLELPVGKRTLHSTYLPYFDDAGEVAGFYALTSDITEQKDTQRKLDALARVDALTGLPNRRHFEERAHETLVRTRRTGRGGALFYLDIDRFKSINDSLGHAGGDELLTRFAARLSAALRESDFVARYAGDEFIAIVEGVASAADAETLAAKVAAAIRAPFTLSTACLRVTTSIGVALFDGDAALDALLAEADAALYAAKDAGRDGFRVARREAQPAGAPAPTVR